MHCCKSGSELANPCQLAKSKTSKGTPRDVNSNKDKEKPNKTTESKHTKRERKDTERQTRNQPKPKNDQTKTSQTKSKRRTDTREESKHSKEAPHSITQGHTRAKREEKRHAPRQKITFVKSGGTSTT